MGFPRFFIVVLQAFALVCTGFAAAQDAPGGSSSSKSKQKTEQHVKASATTPSGTEQAPYRNTEFGFTYQVRYGWVDRTEAMQPEESDPAKSRLLLAAFERPPEATGDTVNSAVIITVESASAYPGLKTAADYMGPLTELTTSKGFKVAQEPYDFSGSSQQLLRSDFTRDLGKLTMYQSSLVLLRKGSIVLFTFIGGSGDEVEELIEKLAFPTGGKHR
jgi:hypothetical protein